MGTEKENMGIECQTQKWREGRRLYDRRNTIKCQAKKYPDIDMIEKEILIAFYDASSTISNGYVQEMPCGKKIIQTLIQKSKQTNEENEFVKGEFEKTMEKLMARLPMKTKYQQKTQFGKQNSIVLW